MLRKTYRIRNRPDLAKDRRGKLGLCKEGYGSVALDEARVGRISEGEVVGKGQALGRRQLEGWSCAAGGGDGVSVDVPRDGVYCVGSPPAPACWLIATWDR